MTIETMKLAREAGWPSVALDNLPGTEDMHRLERFAALVAADEREACAQVAEDMLRFYTQAVTGVPQAIRARGQE
jgi:hypothetical protein